MNFSQLKRIFLFFIFIFNSSGLPHFSSEKTYLAISKMIIENKINDCTIITICNYGYRNFTLNWIMHLEKYGFKKFVVFCFDTKIFAYLKEKGYKKRIIMVPNEWLDFELSVEFSSWASTNYNHIVQSKTNIWYNLVKLGHNILFSDPDVVWLNKHILEHLDFIFKYSRAQILFSQDSQDHTNYYNTGFFYAKSSAYTIDLFMKIIEIQRKDPKNAMEQTILNNLLTKNKYNDCRLVGLDPILFASGRIVYQKKLLNIFTLNPYTVHANYIAGQPAKISALKSSNMWLIE